MIKVAYFPMSPSDPAAFYRMGGVFNYIRHPGIEFFDITQKEQYNWESFRGATHFILQRPHTEAHIALISLAKDMDIKIISDWDDDLFNVPVHRNASVSHDDIRKNMKRCLALSDETWVTTPELKKIYKPYCKNIHIIPNAHPDQLFPVDKRMPFTQRKLAVYRGGKSHDLDIYQDINDLVKTFEHDRKWEFRFVGAGDMEKPGETIFPQLDYRTKHLKNHTYTNPSTLIQFFKLYHASNAPIAFYPLVTNQFNRSKSNISLLEATYAGSAFLGNKNLPEFNHDFVTDISEGLFEPFKDIKDNYAKMLRLNDQAWSWVVEERLLSKINLLRVERLCSLH